MGQHQSQMASEKQQQKSKSVKECKMLKRSALLQIPYCQQSQAAIACAAFVEIVLCTMYAKNANTNKDT